MLICKKGDIGEIRFSHKKDMNFDMRLFEHD